MTDPPRSGERLRVSVVDAAGRSVRAPALASWLRRVAPRRAQGSVTIALVSDARVRELNRAYRGIDQPTDVLSFAVPEVWGRASALQTASSPEGVPHRHMGGRASALKMPSGPKGLPHMRHLGDVVIARGVATRQARRARHSTATELRILALHGLLHLLGYDHERDDGRMARVEGRLRRKGGLPPGLIERQVSV